MRSLTDQLSSSPVLLLTAIAAVVFVVVAAVLLRSRAPWPGSVRPRPLMTENKKAFFRTLQRALPNHCVFPQVAFAAFLTHDKNLNQRHERNALRSRFNRKIADFVICDRETLGIVAIVELDDRTHSRANDGGRDELTKAAGYHTFRFQSTRRPTEADIADLFDPTLKARVPESAGAAPARQAAN